MNNHLRLTLAIIFLSTILYGQGITKEEIIKFKIKSITAIDENEAVKSIEYFNDDGEIVRIDNFDEKTRKEFVYDSNRFLTEERTYKTDGVISTIIKFYYNESNQLIKKESLYHGNVTTIWIYEYDHNGNLKKESEPYSVTVFKYRGMKLVRTEKTKLNFGKEETTDYSYHENGQLSGTKSKFYLTNTTFTMKCYYDEKGKLIETNTKQITGSYTTSSKTTYHYNDKGLLESMTWKDPVDNKLYKVRYIVEL